MLDVYHYVGNRSCIPAVTLDAKLRMSVKVQLPRILRNTLSVDEDRISSTHCIGFRGLEGVLIRASW